MSIKCPYPDCAKKIDQLIMLIDYARLPRETYYACPHCKNRIDLTFEKGCLKFSSHSRNTKRKRRTENKSPKLPCEKAIKALHDFIAELEGQRGKELTDKEAMDSIKIVEGVISSLQATLPGDEQDHSR